MWRSGTLRRALRGLPFRLALGSLAACLCLAWASAIPAAAQPAGSSSDYQAGYNTGFHVGFKKGFNSGFNSGYSNGYNDAGQKASSAAVEPRSGAEKVPAAPPNHSPAYQAGFRAGFHSGFNSGYKSGYKDGYPAGEKANVGAAVVDYAKRFIGTPYQYGGNGPASFDCSGFTVYVYQHFGYQLPRTSYEQMGVGQPVSGPLELGDLVFWAGGGHVGIYTGNDTFISATVSKGIWIYSFSQWSSTQSYTTARRILGTSASAVKAKASGAPSGGPRNGGPADARPRGSS